MDRYERVARARADSSAIEENEVRITAGGLIRSYVNYATALLQEKRLPQIVLRGMGQAISKSVAVAEILKKRLPPPLHQISTPPSAPSASPTSGSPSKRAFSPSTRRAMSPSSPSLSPPNPPSTSTLKIHTGKGEGGEGAGHEEEVEGEVGAGEAMVGTATTKGAMEDTATAKVDTTTTEGKAVDIETIKERMLDMATAIKGDTVSVERAVAAGMTLIKKMMAIMWAGRVVCEVEEIGAIEEGMKEEEVVALGAEGTTVEGDAWVVGLAVQGTSKHKVLCML